MKVVVTGVAGFIGSHIAERLVNDSFEVIGIDDLSAGYEQNIPSGVNFYRRDIYDIEKFDHIFKDVDVIFHQAASKKNICLKNPARDMEVNGIATLKLLQSAMRNGVRKFIHASTGSVYGEVNGVITEDTPRKPCSYYGISKMAGESYVSYFNQQFGLDTTILRYFHVYGDRQEKRQDTGGVIAIFSDKIKRGESIIIHGNGEQQRVFTSVKDIVDANIRSIANTKACGKIYNCASSVQTNISEVALLLMKKFNKKVSIIYSEPLIGDIYTFNVDSSRIHNDLGIKFKSINEVL